MLIEESVLGWKEFELEVMRDRTDNFIVVCSIENLDPMGVHTGDSITVAPAMTLTDREYQRLRDAARAVMTEIGVETGGSNVQFAVSPKDGRVLVIEMNPRVSRSSALASKATGYPIAKIAAKLAVGYTLDELKNDITRTSAAFEPVIDYVVVKWPRFAFEKFPGADATLGTQMKSVGEVMSIGRTFCEALQKAARSLETGRDGLGTLLDEVDYRVLAERATRTQRRDLVMDAPEVERPRSSRRPLRKKRSAHCRHSFRFRPPTGSSTSPTRCAWASPTTTCTSARASTRGFSRSCAASSSPRPHPRRARRGADARRQAARLQRPADRQALERERGRRAGLARDGRHPAGLRPRRHVCRRVRAHTPYLYSTYETESESQPSARSKVVILGGGPNRIGQGIEFDYCCVHAVQALRELGHETIMVNCNPETVSTDYDTCDRLYFEPLTLEDVLAIVATRSPRASSCSSAGRRR